MPPLPFVKCILTRKHSL